MKATQLREKNVSDLQSELSAVMKELFNLRIQKAMGQFSQTHIFKNLRRDVARIKTVLKEKEGLQS